MTDCPDGRMNKDKMKEMFNAVAPSVGPDSTFKLKGQCYEIFTPPTPPHFFIAEQMYLGPYLTY